MCPPRQPGVIRRWLKYIVVLALIVLYRFKKVGYNIYKATRSDGMKLRNMATRRLARTFGTSESTTNQQEGDWTRPIVEEREVCRDGVRLVYRVAKLTESHGRAAGSATTTAKRNKHTKVVLYCCPLGWSGFDALDPLILALGPEYEFICWDYRGFFKSSKPESDRQMSIPDHAHDGAVVLRDFLNLDADCKELPEGTKVLVAGHSMGVQVGLELSLLYPKLVSGLLLYNGAHGQVFRSAYQVVSCYGLRIPFLSSMAPFLASFFLARTWLLPLVYKYVYNTKVSKYFLKFYAWSRLGSGMMRKMKGDNYLFNVYNNYLTGVVSNPMTCRSYALSFQMLDMHSVKYTLGDVYQPTLLVSGLWDPLTPCAHMFEMAKEIPNSQHKCDFFSTHATMVEHPEFAVEYTMQFLAEKGFLGNNEVAKIENKTPTPAVESVKSVNMIAISEPALLSQSQKESEQSQGSTDSETEEEIVDSRNDDSWIEDPITSCAPVRLERVDDDASSCSSRSTSGDIENEEELRVESAR